MYNLNVISRTFDIFSYKVFFNSVRNIKALKWSCQTFNTCQRRYFNLNEKVQHLNIEAKAMQDTIKDKSNKPVKRLNFKSLMNYKRKVNIEIVPESTKGKKPRSVVDLKLMTEELKQLQDPPASPWEKQISSARLPFSFYDVDCQTLAKNMLGKILTRKLDNGTILKGRIVETESYLGVEDKASHTYNGKVTPRNIPMYMPPGTIYVYFTYGMYHCFNISSKEEGSAVLVRAIEPLKGIEHMTINRSLKPKAKVQKQLLQKLKVHELCNGPSKICMAMKLEKEHSKYSMCDWKGLWIEDDGMQEEIKIIECSRIGIESAGEEWASKPLRYYIHGHKCVSKRDKKAESIILPNSNL